uniref:Uncharacterized protein n=1 Tax=Chrysemys picta bellii TaxID=8478 RepID=A0A8C3P7F4_CHRPI
DPTAFQILKGPSASLSPLAALLGVRPNSVHRPTDMSRELSTVTTAARAKPHFDFTMSIFPARENTRLTKRLSLAPEAHLRMSPIGYSSAAGAVLRATRKRQGGRKQHG